MATEATITADDDFFIGEDKTLTFGPVLDGAGVPVNITGWALSWRLKRSRDDTDALAALTKTTVADIVISGTYSATVASNTQRAVVTIADTDTDAIRERLYYHELKRTDAGLETVLSFGSARLKRGVHRT